MRDLIPDVILVKREEEADEEREGREGRRREEKRGEGDYDGYSKHQHAMTGHQMTWEWVLRGRCSLLYCMARVAGPTVPIVLLCPSLLCPSSLSSSPPSSIIFCLHSSFAYLQFIRVCHISRNLIEQEKEKVQGVGSIEVVTL